MATWCSRDITGQILIVALLTPYLINHSGHPPTTGKAFQFLFISDVASTELSSDQCHYTKARHSLGDLLFLFHRLELDRKP